jgi:hypothetical protein
MDKIIEKNRVQLVVERQDVRRILGQKGVFLGGKYPKRVWEDTAFGTGKTGQIKKAGWFGRSITLLDVKLNRGSVIDFVNRMAEEINTTNLFSSEFPVEIIAEIPLKALVKGGLFKRGSSDEAIRILFDKVCKAAIAKPSLLAKIDNRWTSQNQREKNLASNSQIESVPAAYRS